MTYQEIAELFNKEFDPCGGNAQLYSNYDNSVDAKVCDEFFRRHLLTDDVCGKFLNARIRPTIRRFKNGNIYEIRLTLRLMKEHPLHSYLLRNYRQPTSFVLFEQHRRKVNGSFCYCSCKPAVGYEKMVADLFATYKNTMATCVVKPVLEDYETAAYLHEVFVKMRGLMAPSLDDVAKLLRFASRTEKGYATLNVNCNVKGSEDCDGRKRSIFDNAVYDFIMERLNAYDKMQKQKPPFPAEDYYYPNEDAEYLFQEIGHDCCHTKETLEALVDTSNGLPKFGMSLETLMASVHPATVQELVRYGTDPTY